MDILLCTYELKCYRSTLLYHTQQKPSKVYTISVNVKDQLNHFISKNGLTHKYEIIVVTLQKKLIEYKTNETEVMNNVVTAE